MGEVIRLLNEENVVNKFLDQFRSQDSLRTYRGVIKDFFGINAEYVNDGRLVAVTYSDVQKYVKGLFENKSSNTVKKNVSCLSGLFEYAVGEEIIKKNWFSDSRLKGLMKKNLKKDEIGKGIALSKGEIGELLERIENKRDRVMIGFSLRSGLRGFEVVKVKWEDFIQKDGRWFVKVVGKGNKERIVNISEKVVEEVKDYMKCYGIGNGELFKMSTRNFNYILEKYSEISSHDLRRSYITNLLKDGVGLVKVQKAVGHSNARTTERYFKENDIWSSDVGEMVSW